MKIQERHDRLLGSMHGAEAVKERQERLSVRQPWEMTLSEWLHDVNDYWKKTGINQASKLEWMKGMDMQSDLHKKLVIDALAEGKTVPPEVLADYPGLQKKDMSYRINPTLTKLTTRYGLSIETYTWPAHTVAINLRPNDFIFVYHTKSGWIVADETTGERKGRQKKGVGWIGFDTPEQAVENFINIISRSNQSSEL